MEALTPRQRAVAELVAAGRTSKAIAGELGLSVDTVKAHVVAAASRIPGDGSPRHRLTLHVLKERREP